MKESNIFTQIAQRIINEQEGIIGPVALEQAKKVKGLRLSDHQVSIQGDESNVIDDLVKQYQKLFGQTSVEVCKDAASGLVSQLSPKEVPSLLR